LSAQKPAYQRKTHRLRCYCGAGYFMFRVHIWRCGPLVLVLVPGPRTRPRGDGAGAGAALELREREKKKKGGGRPQRGLGVCFSTAERCPPLLLAYRLYKKIFGFRIRYFPFLFLFDISISHFPWSMKYDIFAALGEKSELACVFFLFF
jgi:hypothetical protein